MLRDWIQKHRKFLQKNSGMEEKKEAIELKKQATNRVNTILDKLNLEHPLHTRVSDVHS